jgi:hypothetical protein
MRNAILSCAAEQKHQPRHLAVQMQRIPVKRRCVEFRRVVCFCPGWIGGNRRRACRLILILQDSTGFQYLLDILCAVFFLGVMDRLRKSAVLNSKIIFEVKGGCDQGEIGGIEFAKLPYKVVHYLPLFIVKKDKELLGDLT